MNNCSETFTCCQAYLLRLNNCSGSQAGCLEAGQKKRAGKPRPALFHY
jgi:hypothetical protein